MAQQPRDHRLVGPGVYIDRWGRSRVRREALRRNRWTPTHPDHPPGSLADWRSREATYLVLWDATHDYAKIDLLQAFVDCVAQRVFPEYDLPLVARMHPEADGPSVSEQGLFLTIPELPEQYLTGVMRDAPRAVETAARNALEQPTGFFDNPVATLAEMLGGLVYQTSLLMRHRFEDPVSSPDGLSPRQAADSALYRDAYLGLVGSHLGLFSLLQQGPSRPLSPAVLLPHLQQRTQEVVQSLDTGFILSYAGSDMLEGLGEFDAERQEHSRQLRDIIDVSKALRQDLLLAGSLYPRSGRRRVAEFAEGLYGRLPSELRREELEAVGEPFGLAERLDLPLRPL